jgi:hypothetical protein
MIAVATLPFGRRLIGWRGDVSTVRRRRRGNVASGHPRTPLESQPARVNNPMLPLPVHNRNPPSPPHAPPPTPPPSRRRSPSEVPASARSSARTGGGGAWENLADRCRGGYARRRLCHTWKPITGAVDGTVGDGRPQKFNDNLIFEPHKKSHKKSSKCTYCINQNHTKIYRLKNVSYIVVDCDLFVWYTTYRFAASCKFVDFTFDSLHLSLCSFHCLLFFK